MVQANQPGLFHEVANANAEDLIAQTTAAKTTTSAGGQPTHQPSHEQPDSDGEGNSPDGGSSSRPVVEFDSGFQEVSEDDRVLALRSHTFTWQLGEDATLKKVSWVSWNPDNEPKPKPKAMMHVKRQEDDEATEAVEPTEVIGADYGDDGYAVTNNPDIFSGDTEGGNGVTVDFQAANTAENLDATWLNLPNAIRVDWQIGDEPERHSFSPFFSLTTDTEISAEADLTDDVNSWADKLQCKDGCDWPLESDEPDSGDASGDDDEADEEDGGSSSGGGGLAPGVIAGIVVGAVAGLAIIGFLVWFALRRRRKNARGTFTGTQQTSDAFIADKAERAHDADSPRSPYSDDGNHPTHIGSPSGTAAGLAAASTHHGSIGDEESRPKFTSYHDTRSVDGSNGRQTPQGVSRNVAHLVEDGMTDADIRRLEEEERALDDAIERAGRR